MPPDRPAEATPPPSVVLALPPGPTSLVHSLSPRWAWGGAHHALALQGPGPEVDAGSTLGRMDKRGVWCRH